MERSVIKYQKEMERSVRKYQKKVEYHTELLEKM